MKKENEGLKAKIAEDKNKNENNENQLKLLNENNFAWAKWK